ncbi:MAG: orotidine 5'-phosphate decarboxylase [Thermoproteales archaeon]|nr:orotidine 5'-phosphate decarboxylase [Thermoproteales archaeon]
MTLVKAWEIANRKNSRIIMAIDSVLNNKKPETLISEVADLIVGVKIGLPFLLTYGVGKIKEIINTFQGGIYFLADFKLADIPEIVLLEINKISSLGFNGVITHLFQGGIPKIRKDIMTDIIGVVYMSHKEAYFFKENFKRLLNEAIKSDLDGVVVGAKNKEIMDIINKRMPKVDILSPGIGIQGGCYGEALKNGADFEIIGRAITWSSNPREKVFEILKGERRWI